MLLIVAFLEYLHLYFVSFRIWDIYFRDINYFLSLETDMENWDEPAPVVAELPEIKLFGKWSTDDVQVSDISLTVSNMVQSAVILVNVILLQYAANIKEREPVSSKDLSESQKIYNRRLLNTSKFTLV